MIRNFTDADVGDQSGRTFLVTGANTGLGFETTKVLAAKGGRVLMGCRSERKAEDAIARIKTESPHADLKFVPLDQADLASVKGAAKIVKKESRLDVLINNAGIMYTALEFTKDGFESQFGVNHLGTFALTSHLLPKLEQTKGSRVVITSSNAHKMNAKIYFSDIDGKKSYSRLSRYNQSKLANALFMHELDRRLRATGSHVIITACHPGVAVTDLMRHMPGWSQALMPLVSFLTNTPAQGAWATLAAAVGGDVESGQYFGPMGPGEWTGKAGLTRTTKQARDPELAGKLWDLSIEMTGVDPGI